MRRVITVHFAFTSFLPSLFPYRRSLRQIVRCHLDQQVIKNFVCDKTQWSASVDVDLCPREHMCAGSTAPSSSRPLSSSTYQKDVKMHTVRSAILAKIMVHTCVYVRTGTGTK